MSKRGGRGKRADGKKDPGFYFFIGDWLKCEVQQCSDGAYRLWVEILCRMWESNPRGVFPGDKHEFCARMGQAWPEAAELYWAKWEPLIREMEAKNVFTRGVDIDDALDPEAIINRRMYREWCEEESLSEARRFADSCRKVVREKVSREAIGGCTKMNKNNKRSTNGEQTDQAEELIPITVAGVLGEQDLTKTNRSRSELPDTRFVDRSPVAVRGIAPVVDLVGKKVWARIVEYTNDPVKGPWARWWNEVVWAFEREGHLGRLDEVLHRAEVAEGVKRRAAFLTAKVLELVREMRDKESIDISVPTTPNRKKGA